MPDPEGNARNNWNQLLSSYAAAPVHPEPPPASAGPEGWPGCVADFVGNVAFQLVVLRNEQQQQHVKDDDVYVPLAGFVVEVVFQGLHDVLLMR